jgi:ATP phosphoribosyltransferase regulatory subunit HisZ
LRATSRLAALGVASALLCGARLAAADGPAEIPIVRPEVVIEKHSRLVAAIPFGAGQFQNGALELGVFFASSQALAVAGSIASALVYNRLANTNVNARGASGGRVDIAALNAQILEVAWVNRISFGTWAALVVSGVIEAQVNFVPERLVLRRRPLAASKPAVRPVFSVDARGGEIGILGRF